MAASITRLELGLKISGGTAVVVLMMVLSGPTYSLAVHRLCIGTEVALDKGEAIVRCPLPVSIKGTRHEILVKDFSNLKESILACRSTAEDVDKRECKLLPSGNVSVVVQVTNELMVKVPESMLRENGVYKAQLMPGSHPFIPCRVHRFSDTDEGKRSTVAPDTPVVPSTATKHSTPGQDPAEKEAAPCEGQGSGEKLCVAILVLQSFTIIFLGVHICWQCRNKQRTTGQRTLFICLQRSADK